MTPDRQTRRTFSLHLATVVIGGVLAPVVVAPARRALAQTGSAPELSKTAESIHEDILINAAPAQVYAVLTDPARFSALTKYSMVPKAAPASIAATVGGAFTLFDGHILGRHVELVPGMRVVQAWRSADWQPGVFSIARFELQPRGGATLIGFDHTGFPNGQGQHLLEGWHANYWGPMRKYFGS